jgi:cytochrome c-type biogenesis protein CcmF
VIVELGHLALWLALGVALMLAWRPWRAPDAALPLAQALTGWLAALVLAGYGALTWAFVQADFSVAYVAQHAHQALPLPYRVAAVWGGHEGSLLLWVALLVLWMLCLRRAQLPAPLLARVLAVLGALAAGFLLFLLLTSNPFERMLPALPDGRDLNPLLQDPGMVLHPPLLYMGYVGFSVAFALAMAALAAGELDARWAGFARPWTLAAWGFLTAGIALGSWWAYTELGWGGWWFWDPVENASFMPWLLGTALLHALAVTEKRGAFKAWTALLAILAFSMALLGTFLVRSGVLSSVHAFATDPQRGLFILGFLVAVVGSSLAVFASRASRLGLGARFHWRSRETTLLAGGLMLVVACGAVLLGTLYPLLLDALTGQKLSVGPPYFEAVFVPLMTPMVLLMGVGPLVRWKEAEAAELARRLRLPLLLAPVAAGVHGVLVGALGVLPLLGLLLAWWVAASVVAALAPQWRQWHRMPRWQWGMHVAHLGVAVFIVGVTLVSSLQREEDVKLAPGGRAEAAGLPLQLLRLERVEGPNYSGVRAQLEVVDPAGEAVRVQPEKRIYATSEMPMTEAGIASSLWRDIYVALGEPVDGGQAWLLRVSCKPFVNWIWGGCVLMALGAALALGRRRVP